MHILLLSDIHSNYPALNAIASQFELGQFAHIVNCGDSLVYAPFPNETLTWLRENRTVSILGNTDRKVIKLLKGKDFKKPADPEKRIMYTSIATELAEENQKYLLSLGKTATLQLTAKEPDSSKATLTIGIFHGSPADPDEFLFDTTPDSRFIELAAAHRYNIIVTGHSHTPYVKFFGSTCFINPGSAGRMFDNDPRASCAIIEIDNDMKFFIHHLRISYDTEKVIRQLARKGLPPVYGEMFRRGRKLN